MTENLQYDNVISTDCSKVVYVYIERLNNRGKSPIGYIAAMTTDTVNRASCGVMAQRYIYMLKKQSGKAQLCSKECFLYGSG